MHKNILILLISFSSIIHCSTTGLFTFPRLEQLATKQCASIILNAPDFEHAINLAHRGTSMPIWEIQPAVKELLQKELHQQVLPIPLISTILIGHSDQVNSVAWSPCGTKLATASDDGTIRIWTQKDASSWSFVILPDHKHKVLSVAWNHDGTMLASGGGDHYVRLWTQNPDGSYSGTRLKTKHPLTIYSSSHDDYVNCVSWSHNGTRITSASDDGHYRIWDLIADGSFSDYGPRGGGKNYTKRYTSAAWNNRGTQLATASVHDALISDINGSCAILEQGTTWRNEVNSVAWNHVGTKLATGASDGTVKIHKQKLSGHNLENGSFESATLTGHQGSVHSVSWKHDNSLLATASSDKTVKIWPQNQDNPNISLTLNGHTDSVLSAAWNHDGTRLASGSKDTTVRILQVPDTASLSLEQLIAVVGVHKIIARGEKTHARSERNFMRTAFPDGNTQTALKNSLEEQLDALVPQDSSCLVQ